jgi:N-acetylglucosamine-6-phosphate deacetylase
MNRKDLHAVAADHVFDGATRHANAAVVIEGSKIKCVIPQSGLPRTIAAQHLPAGAWLAPGFIDLQVNGGGDVLFNNSPTSETIATIAAAHRRYGTTAFLPTFITDTGEKMRAALAAVLQTAEKDPSVLGIHLEGPFLSPEKAGVHDHNLMRCRMSETCKFFAVSGHGRCSLPWLRSAFPRASSRN